MFEAITEMRDLIDEAISDAVDERYELLQGRARRFLHLDDALERAWMESAASTPDHFDSHRRGVLTSRAQRRRGRAAAVGSGSPPAEVQ